MGSPPLPAGSSIKLDRDYFVQSVIVGYKPGKRWDYTFEWSLRNENLKYRTKNMPPGSGSVTHPSSGCEGAYGINQELIYHLNAKWAVGLP